ncbi:MAG: hypothetical protein WCZ87_00335 [Thiohalobacteraceae bacterium]
MGLTGKQQPGADNGSWPSKTIHWGDGHITVVRRTVGRAKTAQRIVAQLPPAEDFSDQTHQQVFARLASQTTEIEGLAISFPDLGDGVDAWRAAYAEMDNWDDPLLNLWYEAVEDVDRAFGPRDLLPTRELSEAERKKQPSAESS